MGINRYFIFVENARPVGSDFVRGRWADIAVVGRENRSNLKWMWMMMDVAPSLGRAEDAFIGNGIVGAAISAFGEITFSIGPDYTSPNFISSGKLALEIDGVYHCALPPMHRVRHTGIFTGRREIAGILVEISYFTLPEQPLFLQKISLANCSHADRTVGVFADIHTEKPAAAEGDALRITAPVGDWCFGNQETRNWKERTLHIRFSDACEASRVDDGFYRLSSGACTLDAGEQRDLLVCYVHEDNSGCSVKALEHIASHRVDDLLDQSVSTWRQWLAQGTFQSDRTKLGDVIEGCLFAIKMQQNRDGGLIAGIHKYANSYVRDCHGGPRLLIATGHFEECRRMILNIHAKFCTAGFIPNWWSMGSDAFIGESFYNNASEVTAYYLFLLRDYMNASKDIAFFETVYESARWAADVQLKDMLNHYDLLSFNGDETEQYTCKADGEEYGAPGVEGWDARHYSFSATCAALASLEFMAAQLQSSGREEPYSRHVDRIRAAIDSTFYHPGLQLHSWAAHHETLEPLSNVVTNYHLIPFWIGARLNGGAERTHVLKMLEYLNPDTGFLPNSHPDTRGFCGHSLGLLLYGLVKLGRKADAERIAATILNSPLLGRWGTVNEFYGPGCVPNGHVYRCFESGILGEALLCYRRLVAREEEPFDGV